MNKTILAGRLDLPNGLTLSGLICALAGCCLAVQGQPALAYVGLILAGIFDLFDGWAARRKPRSEQARRFGVQLDSLIDMASFGITPVIIALHVGLNSCLDFVFFAFFASCAAMRLAHFNTHQEANDRPVKYYTGLPVTYAALVFPSLFLCVANVSEKIEFAVLRAAFLVLSIAFVVRVPIPKPRSFFYLLFPILALAVTVGLVLGSKN